jgi:hypothetical protein
MKEQSYQTRKNHRAPQSASSRSDVLLLLLSECAHQTQRVTPPPQKVAF